MAIDVAGLWVEPPASGDAALKGTARMFGKWLASRNRLCGCFVVGPRVLFVTVLAACLGITAVIARYQLEEERYAITSLISEKSEEIHDTITRLLSKTQALAALVVQNDGRIENFERVAAALVDDAAIQNVLLAPGGVVANVYPVEGNEKVLGFDLLGPGRGNREAEIAMQKRELVFGGPFRLVQGGEAFVGRLPVFVPNGDGGRKFWGLVSVTLKYPDALNAANLEAFEYLGFPYVLWRINPDNGDRQIIAAAKGGCREGRPFIEKRIGILNADWHFLVYCSGFWYERAEIWTMAAVSVIVSLLIASLFQQNTRLKAVKEELEAMVCSDPLTGLLNRTGLFREMEAMERRHAEFVLWYVDLDYFKQINDTYGHAVGDMVLIRFCQRIRRSLPEECLFARISGDEFILVCPASKRSVMESVWRDVDAEGSEPVASVGHDRICITFSRGMACRPEDGETADELMGIADKRMYREKNSRYSAEKRRRVTDYFIACSS